MVKRDYETEIIQALKEKPRDGLTLQEDLNIRMGRTPTILKEMSINGTIRWNYEGQVWQVGRVN